MTLQALVVVPTYNEIDSLELAVEQALDADAAIDVLVVDDASPDGTGELAKRLAQANSRVHALHRPGKCGLGAAYLAGFAWAFERGYDALCEMDADLSHDPADLRRLLTALRGADVVVGSRYVPGGRIENWPLHRRALSRSGNRYVRALTGIPVADATAGFRAYRSETLLALGLADVRSDGYSFQLELLLRAWRAGFRIVEVPVTFTERRQGASKMTRAIVFEALWRVLVWGLVRPRRPTGIHPSSVASR